MKTRALHLSPARSLRVFEPVYNGLEYVTELDFAPGMRYPL